MTRPMRAAGGMCAAGIVLATGACGGGGPSVSSAQNVAAMVGCTDLRTDSEELFVTEGGSCQSPQGGKWSVYYFASHDARDSYLQAAGQFGGQYLAGDHWAVSAKPATLRHLQEEVGGEIVP